eukprot:12268759-Alexandrium_andersonii.AAC.1
MVVSSMVVAPTAPPHWCSQRLPPDESGNALALTTAAGTLALASALAAATLELATVAKEGAINPSGSSGTGGSGPS